MWRRIPCFANFPFLSIQNGILVAKGGQNNAGTPKHKKYISHRQHQDTASVRFWESSDFSEALKCRHCLSHPSSECLYLQVFVYALKCGHCLGHPEMKDIFSMSGVFFFHRGLQFSYFKFPFLLLLLCSAMYTLATEQRTGAELYLAASMWNQETAPTSWHLTQHSRIPDLHPLGLASKPPWGWTMGGGQ